MTAAFSTSIGTSPNGSTIVLSGYLNELATLPSMKKEQKLTIDLDAIIGLNSIGTRKWCLWIAECSNLYEKIALENCPVIFVKTFNQITDSLTDKCLVNSVKIPFYSDAIDERKMVVLYLGKDYSFDGLFQVPQIKDSTGNLMEIDIITENFFNFMKK
jgi:hypothetical protein